MESNIKRLGSNVDLLIKNVQVFNTSICCFQLKDVALRGHVFYLIEDRLNIEAQQVIDGQGKYMLPGLIDIHTHAESSMTYPAMFYEAVLRHGTTTCVIDPHEIANVKGLEGVNVFLDNVKNLDIFFGIPSSVPSTNSHLETTGGKIDLEDVKSLLFHPKIKCLGEVMNFVDMQSEHSKIKEMIALCKKLRPDICIEGHCPKLSGQDLSYYLYCGVDADHTQQTPESILEKTSKGMFIEMQGKSITPENIETIVKHELYEMIAFVTDDTMPHHLVHGHLNEVVKKAVLCGMPIEKAIYCATYTPARRMHLDDRGMIAPGKQADFILLEDLGNLSCLEVYKMGQKHYPQVLPQPHFPKDFYHSLQLKPFQLEDFQLPKVKGSHVKVNVIEIFPNSTFTKRIEEVLEVNEGVINYQKAGLSLICAFERYGKKHHHSYALVKGAFTQKAAVATTWAHDHHNFMVMGNEPSLMLQIANAVYEVNGGYGVCTPSQQALTPLPIGGIVSDQPIEVLGEQLKKVADLMEEAGYHHMNPIMSFATLSLPASPEIKITDVGMIEVRTQKIIPLIVEEAEHENIS